MGMFGEIDVSLIDSEQARSICRREGHDYAIGGGRYSGKWFCLRCAKLKNMSQEDMDNLKNPDKRQQVLKNTNKRSGLQ